MLEKFAEAVFAYSFAVAELLGAFFERTPTVIGLGVPLLLMVGAHVCLPPWVGAAIWTFVLGPAAAAMTTVIVHGLILSSRR